MWRASLEECLAQLIQGLKTALEGADDEPAQAGDPGQVKGAVEQLSRYLAESNAAAIDYFEAAAPHLRILFDRTIRTFCRPDRELCVLRSVRGTDGRRGEEMISRRKSDSGNICW